MKPNCALIDSLVTPYVDGELPGPERQRVDEHMRVCPPCRQRLLAEDTARQLVRGNKAGLTAPHAPASLRTQCAMLASLKPQPAAPGVPRRSWRSVVSPLALAASLVAVVGGAFLYRATGRSDQLVAEELTADHIKCFGLDDLIGTHDSPDAVETSMLAGFDWHMHVPDSLARAGLELVGGRTCLYARGKMAHIMFRYQGQPVSVFMLPGAMRPDDLVEAFGHEAVIWSVGGRSFVLVARGSRDEVGHMASFVKASLHE